VSAEAILVHAGLHERGGVSVDVWNLVEGLGERGRELEPVGSLRALRAALREHPRALVHVFGCLPSATIFGSMAAAKVARRPLVWTPVFHPSRRRSWKGYGFLRAMAAFDAVAPRATRLTDAVVAATPAEAEYFAGLGAARVELIPPGVPRIPGEDEAAGLNGRRRFGLGPGPVVLTVARDNSRKGFPFGLAAFDALRARAPEAQLLLVGPEPDHPASQRPGVVCSGWLEQDDVELAFRTADLVFVPSLYEGLPRVVIEAWRFGRAVVATDRVALAPTVEEGGGRVVRYGRPGDAAAVLADVLGRPALARTYGDKGRVIVRERFLLDRVVPETGTLYRELMEAA
jgi:glycosyltransferase involved in cell wall biosynthesis